MSKKNCWEVMKCGREPGGVNTYECAICPAAIEIRANGINGGKNGGRACWAIAGTFCCGKIQGTFTEKHAGCLECEFYKLVTSEEDRCLTAVEILKKMKESK